jgi:hypothetical protein
MLAGAAVRPQHLALAKVFVELGMTAGRREAKQALGAAVSKRLLTNFVHSLIAVLAGNAAYFLLLPFMPLRARHTPFHLDLGLAVDCWFCLVALGMVKTLSSRKRESKLGKR